MKLSVVMPVYNARPYLASAVESILQQTMRDFEFIIVDDGSTDGSSEMLREYASGDARIRLISRENRGLVASLNEGLAAANGELVARMDADDIAMPQRFEKQIAFLDAHPECVVVGSAVIMIDGQGEPLCIPYQPLRHETIVDRLMHSHGSPIYHPSAMMRREIVMSLGGYRPQYEWSEDLDLWLRLSEHGKVANLPELLLRYRRTPGTGSRVRQGQQLENTREIIREAFVRQGRRMPRNWRIVNPRIPTRAEQQRDRAWAALGQSRPKAFYHTFLALGMNPLSLETWRIFALLLRPRRVI